MVRRADNEEIHLYRTPQFERCRTDLRKKGGSASEAAESIDAFIQNLMRNGNGTGREQFRYTRNGEYRIRHCKKISLGYGYRLVLIQKDGCYIFLYAGSHDDCFRWIERNKGLSYGMDWASDSVDTVRETRERAADDLPDDLLEEKTFTEQYEKKIMEQLDDNTLARIFSGLSHSARNKG